MGGWQFDFSGLSPLIQGITSRQFSALDAQRDRQGILDSQADRAYREWLKNNAQKRGIARGKADMERRGFDASQALQVRMEKQAADARFEAGEEKRRAFLAAHAAAQRRWLGASGGYGRGEGITHDFYTSSGRGGGGDAAGR